LDEAGISKAAANSSDTEGVGGTTVEPEEDSGEADHLE